MGWGVRSVPESDAGVLLRPTRARRKVDAMSEFIDKATALGTRIGEAEIAEEYDERKKIRTEWVEFRDSLPASLVPAAIDAYYQGYRKFVEQNPRTPKG